MQASLNIQTRYERPCTCALETIRRYRCIHDVIVFSICCDSWLTRKRRLRRAWSRRRFKGTVVLFVEAISQLLNLSFFVIPNVYVLVRPCGWRDDIVLWSAFASWTCWNTLFLMSVVRTLRLSSCQLWHHDTEVDGHILLPFCLLLTGRIGLCFVRSLCKSCIMYTAV